MPEAFNCGETYRRMQDYLDRELDESEIAAVRVHLEQCGMCAEEYRFEASVLRYMKGGFSDIPIPLDLESRCLGALGDDPL